MAPLRGRAHWKTRKDCSLGPLETRLTCQDQLSHLLSPLIDPVQLFDSFEDRRQPTHRAGSWEMQGRATWHRWNLIRQESSHFPLLLSWKMPYCCPAAPGRGSSRVGYQACCFQGCCWECLHARGLSKGLPFIFPSKAMLGCKDLAQTNGFVKFQLAARLFSCFASFLSGSLSLKLSWGCRANYFHCKENFCICSFLRSWTSQRYLALPLKWFRSHYYPWVSCD